MNSTGRVIILMRRSFLFLVGILFLFSGCSSGSFVGKRVDNFTAYYNKFFNAKKKMEAGVASLERQDQPIDRSIYISIFSASTQANTTSDFNDAVQKGADILREHPDSKWVDDALLLIGQAYFYQQNFVGAEQKFREVIDVSPSLADEARFWLARTLIAAGNYDQANEHLVATLGRDDIGRRWESLLSLAYGELFVRREQWDDAALQLEHGLERGPGGDIGARAQFLLGQVYEKLGRYEDAVNAFRRVDRYKPLFELSYAAQYSAVRVLGSYLDSDAALKSLRKMEHDDKFFNNRAELSFLRGRIYQAQGLADEAFYIYDDLLYITDENVSTIRGRVHYALAELYRDAYQDFQLAAAHFDTARTSISQGGGRSSSMSAAARAERSLYTSEAITDASELAGMFKSFATVRGEIALMDSLLYIGSLEEEDYQAFVQDLRRQRAEEIKAIQREQARRQAERGFQEAGNVNRPRQSAQSGGQGDAESGFLFHRNRMRMEDGWLSFIDHWGERPLVPNWRRAEAVSALASSPSSRDTLGGAAAGGSLSDLSLPPVDLSAIPRDSLKQAKMRAQRAVARYELANVLFLSMNLADSASTWYRLVIDEDSEEEVAQRSYFALAEVHRSLGDTLASNRLYQQILQNYPDSDYIGEVRHRLGLEAPVQVLTDSLALAEAAYADAYTLWQSGSYERALQKMVGVALEYSSTTVAPRALFACGSIYQEWAARDNLDLFGRLPLGVPDSLLHSSGLIKVRVDSSLVTDSTALDSVLVIESVGIDSTAQDSLGAPANVAMDTTSVESLVVSDFVTVDSTAGDSVLVASLDTSLLTADTSGVVSDSLQKLYQIPEPVLRAPATEPDDQINLETLYASLVDGFAQTPFAERAKWMLEALAEQKAPTGGSDSTLIEVEDGIPVDSSLTAPADSVLLPDIDLDGDPEPGPAPEYSEPDSEDSSSVAPDAVDDMDVFQEDQLDVPPDEFSPDDTRDLDSTDVDFFPQELP